MIRLPLSGAIVFIFSVALVTPAAFAGTTPVAEYLFNNNADDTGSGLPANGTIVGGTFVPDRFGNADSAISFAGTDGQGVTVVDGGTNPAAAKLRITGAITISFWLKLSNTSLNLFMRPISKKATATTTDGYEVDYNPTSNQLTLRAFNNPNGDLQITSGATDIDTNWHHIAGTIIGDDISSVFTLYVDGLPVGTATERGLVAGPANFVIGNTSQNRDTDRLRGAVDDVRIYDQVLSALAIRLLANDNLHIWSGGGTTNNFSDAGNWVEGRVPTGVSGQERLIFGTDGTARLSPNNDLTGATFASIAFETGGYTLTGNALNVSGATGLSLTGGATALNTNLVLTGATTFTIPAGATLSCGGAIDLGANNLTLNATGDVSLTGVVSGTGGLVKNNTGVLTLSGASTFSGPSTLAAGAITLGSNSAFDVGGAIVSGPLGVAVWTSTAGTLQDNGAPRLLGNIIRLVSTLTIAGTQPIDLRGSLSLNNPNTTTRTLTIDNTSSAGLILSNPTPAGVSSTAGAVFQDGTTGVFIFRKNGAGRLTVQGAMGPLSGNFEIAAGTVYVEGANGKLGNFTGTAAIDVLGGALLEVDDATAAVAVTGAVAGRIDDADALRINNNATVTFRSNTAAATTEIIGAVTLNTGKATLNLLSQNSQNMTLDAATYSGGGGRVNYVRQQAVAGAGTLIFIGRSIAAGTQANSVVISGPSPSLVEAPSIYVNNTTGFQPLFNGGSFISVANGNWNAPATWLSNNDIDGIPDADDMVTIASNHVVTLTGDESTASLTFLETGNVTGAPNKLVFSTANATVVTSTNSGVCTISSNVTFGTTVRHVLQGTAGRIVYTGTVDGAGGFSHAVGNTPGILEFQASNLFNGTSTTTDNTQIVIGANNALGVGTVTISGGNTTTLTSTAPVTLANILRLNQSLIIGAGSDITLSGNLVIDGAANSSRTITVNTGIFTLDAAGQIQQANTGGRLTKTGVGTLVINRPSLLTGNTPGAPDNTPHATRLAAGTLRVSHASALGTNNRFYVTGGTLELTADLAFLNSLTIGGTMTYSSPFTASFGGTASTLFGGSRTVSVTDPAGKIVVVNGLGQDAAGRALTKTGTGEIELRSASGFTGALNVNEGTVRLSGTLANSASTPAITIPVGGTLIHDNTAAASSARIDDGDIISLSGGTLRVLNSSATAVAESIGGINAASSTSTIEIVSTGGGATDLISATPAALSAGASLDYVRNGAEPVRLLLTGTPVGVLSGITINNQVAGYDTVQGVIPFTAAGATFTSAATGPWTTPGTWTVTGTDADGVPDADDAVVIGAGHDVSLTGASAAALLTFTGGRLLGTGTLSIGSTEITVNGTPAIEIGAGVTLDLGAGETTFNTTGLSTVTVNGPLTGGSLRKRGPGTVVLAATNTYAGATTVTAGVLSISANENLGSAAAASNLIVNNGATLRFTAPFDATNRVLTLQGTTTLDAAFTNGTVAPFFVTFPSAIAATSSSLIKTGTGTLHFKAASTRTGSVTINGGAIRCDLLTGNVLGAAGTPVTVNNTGNLEIAVAASTTATFALPVTLNDGATIRSLGNASSAGATNWTGVITIASAAITTFDVPTGIVAGNEIDVGRLNGTLTGGGAGAKLRMTGNGRKGIQMATNTFDGEIELVAGSANVNAASTLGANSNVVRLTGGELIMNSTGATYTCNLILAGGAISSNTANNTWAGPIQILGTGSRMFNRPIALTGTPATQAVTYSGLISGSGDLSIPGPSTAAVFFTNPANTYSGTITLSATGLLEAQAPGTLGTAATPATVVINASLAGGNLRLKSNTSGDFNANIVLGSNATIDARALTTSTGATLGLGRLEPGTFTLTTASNAANSGYALDFKSGALLSANTTVTPDTASLAVSGVVDDGAGSFSLTKTGASTLTLAAANTFDGGVNVNTGMLLVTNTSGSASGTGTLALAANTVLGGTGRIGGPVAVAGNGEINPGLGTATGSLTLNGAATLNANARLSVDVNGAGAGQYDTLILGASGSISLDAAATLSLVVNTPTATNDALTLIDNQSAGAIGGTFAGLPESARLVAGGRLLSATYAGGSGNDLVLTDLGAPSFTATVTPTSLSTTEGGAAQTFQVILNNVPSADVTLSLNNGNPAEGSLSANSLTFTAANWFTPQTVTVTPVDELIDDGNQNYTITTGALSSADANFNGVAVPDVSVTNADNDTTGVQIVPSGLVTTEAGSEVTLTVNLTSRPTAPVDITFVSTVPGEGSLLNGVVLSSTRTLTFPASDDAVNVPQTVIVRGIDELIDDGDQTYTVQTNPAVTADATYTGFNAADTMLTNTDNDTAGVNIQVTSTTTAESGTTFNLTVALTSQPLNPVSIAFNTSDNTEGRIVDGATLADMLTLNFAADPSAVNTPQTVTIQGIDDLIDDGDIAYSIVASNTVSTDPNFGGLFGQTIPAVNTDDDSIGITVNAVNTTTTEGGGEVTFTVRLSSRPTAPVSLTLSTGNNLEGRLIEATVPVDATTLVFPADDTAVTAPQTVTVRGIDDLIDDGNQIYSIVLQALSSADTLYNNVDPADLSFTNTDDDMAGFTFSRTAVDTTEGGAAETVMVRLNSQPLSPVTLSFTSGNTAEASVTATLTFAADASALTNQTLTVTPVDDAAVDGLKTFTITTGVTAGDGNYGTTALPPNIAARNFDDDEGAFVSTTTLNTSEAAPVAVNFTLALSTVPTAPVTLNLTGVPALEGQLSLTSVTFAADETALSPQTVTLTPLDEVIDDGDTAYTISFVAAAGSAAEYIGATLPAINVTNTDNDTAGVQVTPTFVATTEGGPGSPFSVVLLTQPTANVTINLTNGNPAEGALSVPALVFTAANWNVPQTVTVTPQSDSVADGNTPYVIGTTAVSTDAAYNGIAVPDVNVVNSDELPPVISSALTATPNPVTAGRPVTFSVGASDPQGQPLTITYSYGDGTSGAAATHVYTVPQIVTVTATITDGVNTLTSSVSLIVLAAASPDADGDGDGLPNSLDSDDDGDGFSDVLEDAAGSSSSSSASTPALNNANAPAPAVLTIGKMTVKLNFAKPNNDTIQLSGMLVVPAGLQVNGQKILVDVGGVGRAFTLNDKGQSPKGLDTFRLSVKSTGGTVPGQFSKYQLKLNKGSFAAALADEGLTSMNVAKVNRLVRVQIFFNQTLLEKDQVQVYSAKTGKTGKTSSPR